VQSVDGRGQYWRLVFRPPFAANTTYKLTLHSSTPLMDSAQRRLRHISTNYFSILDTTCRNHGQYLEDAGYCLCDAGYAGLVCDLCATGFANVATQPGQVNCSLSLGGQCLVDTCGCLPNIRPCSPIGRCDPNTGGCTCPPAFSGDHCEKCASGYVRYQSNCVKSGECPLCVHGSCDAATKRCVCNDHWTGRTCDECAPGWQGATCSETAAIVTGTPATSQSVVPSTSSGDSLGAAKLVAIVAANIMILSTIAWIIYWRVSKKRSHNYAQVGLEELDAET